MFFLAGFVAEFPFPPGTICPDVSLLCKMLTPSTCHLQKNCGLLSENSHGGSGAVSVLLIAGPAINKEKHASSRS
jgi:hypothetical protein